MKRACLILALSALIVRADSLNEVLSRMDKGAKVFRSLTASVHKVQYVSTLDETQNEDATFRMLKRDKGGVVLLAEFSGKDERKFHMAGNLVQIYYPKAKSVDEIDTHKYTKSADLLFLVGFGTTQADLNKTYEISLGGPETIDGVKTTRIVLVPRSEERKKLFKRIELWFPDGQSNPIQEKVITGTAGKDYTLFKFANEKIRTLSDPPLPASDFELNLPAEVKHHAVDAK